MHKLRKKMYLALIGLVLIFGIGLTIQSTKAEDIQDLSNELNQAKNQEVLDKARAIGGSMSTGYVDNSQVEQDDSNINNLQNEISEQQESDQQATQSRINQLIAQRKAQEQAEQPHQMSHSDLQKLNDHIAQARAWWAAHSSNNQRSDSNSGTTDNNYAQPTDTNDQDTNNTPIDSPSSQSVDNSEQNDSSDQEDTSNMINGYWQHNNFVRNQGHKPFDELLPGHTYKNYDELYIHQGILDHYTKPADQVPSAFNYNLLANGSNTKFYGSDDDGSYLYFSINPNDPDKLDVNGDGFYGHYYRINTHEGYHDMHIGYYLVNKLNREYKKWERHQAARFRHQNYKSNSHCLPKSEIRAIVKFNHLMTKFDPSMSYNPKKLFMNITKHGYSLWEPDLINLVGNKTYSSKIKKFKAERNLRILVNRHPRLIRICKWYKTVWKRPKSFIHRISKYMSRHRVMKSGIEQTILGCIKPPHTSRELAAKVLKVILPFTFTPFKYFRSKLGQVVSTPWGWISQLKYHSRKILVTTRRFMSNFIGQAAKTITKVGINTFMNSEIGGINHLPIINKCIGFLANAVGNIGTKLYRRFSRCPYHVYDWNFADDPSSNEFAFENRRGIIQQ